MNWKELYALVNENIKNAVSGLYKPAGDVTFAELPELSQSVLGYTYTVTDAFTTDNRFTDYDTETQTGHSFPADTEVAVIVTGTTENPVYMFNVMGGIMDGYATKGDLDNYVEKEAGKGLSTNDYTDADKALVQDSPITTTTTGSDLALSTSSGNINAITVYGKSEVVDGSIKSAGEGWSTVDLGTLNWAYSTSGSPTPHFDAHFPKPTGVTNYTTVLPMMCTQYDTSRSWSSVMGNANMYGYLMATPNNYLAITDSKYTDATAFKSAMSGVLLCYQLADPTQGNCIAVKTDNGSGIDGTMAVFETGTPLYGVSDTVRDVMTWDGSAGTVTKNCGEVDLGTLNWSYKDDSAPKQFRASFPQAMWHQDYNFVENIICPLYQTVSYYNFINSGNDNLICRYYTSVDGINIVDNSCTTLTQFLDKINGVMLLYELATPTIEQLTASENNSIAGLRTFQPQTHAQNNAGTTMTVKAYAGTANGKAVNELKQDLQSEISALKITQSDTLTLTTSGWSNNTQVIAYAHDTAKRNVIDVDPASVEEWASCGILATAETATSITFTCKTVPENALNFRVTSMGVN